MEELNLKNNNEWHYVSISYSDCMRHNEMMIMWKLQDLGYPIFGVFYPSADYEKYHYSRHIDDNNMCYVFGYCLI